MRRDWSEIWSVDLRALAALRVGLGTIVLVDLAQRAWDYSAFYSESGIFPTAALRRAGYVVGPFCLHVLSADPFYQALLFLLAAVCTALFLVGWKTPWTTFLTWLLLLSIQLRNPLVLHSGDNLLRLMVMWCFFVPAGARWSADALSRPAPPSPRVASLGTAALLAQVAVMYWSTAEMKWWWAGWRTGEGLYSVMASDFWTRAPAALFLAYPGLLKPLGLAVLCFETCAPFLLFVPSPRVKDAAVASFWLLQLGFGTCLYLGLFPWICAVAMLPFLSPRVWDRLEPAASALAAALRRRRLGPAPAPAWLPMTAWELVDWTQLRNIALVVFMSLLLLNEAETATGRALVSRYTRDGEYALGLYTPWKMFVTSVRYGGWFVFVGELPDGGELDLRTGEAPVRWERPAVITDTFPDMRWVKFYFCALEPPLRSLYDRAAGYYGREWNRRHPDRRVSRARAVFMWKFAARTYGPQTYQPWVIGRAVMEP